MEHQLQHRSIGESRPGYQLDGRWKNTIVEIKSHLHSFRNLRAGLLQLAYQLADDPNARGLLVLVASRITDAGLHKEWRLAEQTLKPEVLARIAIAVERNDRFHRLPADLGADFEEWLRARISRESRASVSRQPSEVIFLLLLHQWLMRQGPMTTNSIMQTVGCSYPTVASALRRLGNMIERSSNRRVKLWGFPAEEWKRVVANLDRVHPTTRYVDRSGQRRTPESLMHRAAKLGCSDVAVGGVIAARHYHPELDLRGTPRLDLTLHSPDGRADLSFVERLDPALERTDRKDEPAALAVHVLHRKASLFQIGGAVLPWADPVESLLGLYDARLEPQAREFLDLLVTSVG